MIKKQSTLERLVSLLQGASLALAILGAFYTFSILYPLGLFTAVLSSFLASLPGLVLLVFFEVVLIQFEKLAELKKQNHLMNEILEKLNKDDQELPNN